MVFGINFHFIVFVFVSPPVTNKVTKRKTYIDAAYLHMAKMASFCTMGYKDIT